MIAHVAVAGANAAAARQLAATLAEAIALEGRRGAAAIELMEPDVLRNDGHFRANVDLIIFMALPGTVAGDAALQRIDQTMRAHLMEAGEPWCVIYGATLVEQVAQARAAIDRLEPTSQPMRPRWQHPCENCSDPACEQKLLSDLLAQRTKRSVG